MAARDEAVSEPQWLDEMVDRLKQELERQLNAMSGAAPQTPAERAADARTLASLERTLEKLAKLEAGRTMAREKKVKAGDVHAALERRLDQRLAGSGRAAGKPERG